MVVQRGQRQRLEVPSLARPQPFAPRYGSLEERSQSGIGEGAALEGDRRVGRRERHRFEVSTTCCRECQRNREDGRT